ncbi:MAG: S-methyl-5'-thioinosine phosphorylase [Gammaproteobacteria bacterium]|nr:S-methyl-5'-thioinosine phosphorylase [Gammaproteobacteria bacterium]MCP5136011.1 S-methyl-5'-thioinosine phosphorylase [Gammaproteobacteria bacterium]
MALGIIGGTGLTRLDGLRIDREEPVSTCWGEPSASLVHGRLGETEVVFLARHGNPHRIPPHKVNYRANIKALKEAGVERVVAVAAVGGITERASPSAVLIPDQIIDYTYGRSTTFFEDDLDDVVHIDFSWPYCAELRQSLLAAAQHARVPAIDGGVYAATQGPRLETAAEIRKLAADGCDIVGMTGMPEAALAREAGLCYASLSVVANWGAGLSSDEITMADIERELETGMSHVRRILETLLAG